MHFVRVLTYYTLFSKILLKRLFCVHEIITWNYPTFNKKKIGENI